jgi:hypothetical protein
MEFSTNAAFTPVMARVDAPGSPATWDTAALATRAAGRPIYWRVASVGPTGESLPDAPPAAFRIDPAARAQVVPAPLPAGPGGEWVVHSLRDGAGPAYGRAAPSAVAARDATGTELNGRDQLLRYELPGWPDEDYTVAVRVRIRELPAGRIGQVFSAWRQPSDDPLRLVVDAGKLYARVEGAGGASTQGVPVRPGEWRHVAAVKSGSVLTLWVDGRPAGSCTVPSTASTLASDCALGGNPHFGGDEFLAARFADFAMYNRALDPAELAALAAPK